MSLSIKAVDRLFTRLNATYGADFLGRYNGTRLSLNRFKDHPCHTDTCRFTNFKLLLESICISKGNMIDRTTVELSYWLSVESFSHHGK